MKFNESLNDFITIVVVLVLVLVLVLVVLVVLVLVILVILVIFVLILIFVLIVIVIIIIISITIIIIVSLSLLLLLLTVFSLFSLLSLSSVSATPSPMISIPNGDYTMYSYGDILNNHHVNHHNQQRPHVHQIKLTWHRFRHFRLEVFGSCLEGRADVHHPSLSARTSVSLGSCRIRSSVAPSCVRFWFNLESEVRRMFGVLVLTAPSKIGFM